MPFESVVSLPSRPCLYPCRPSFYTPRSGRCHALDMINCRRYDGWRAENLGTNEPTHDRRGARSLVVPSPRACPCREAVHHARQPNPPHRSDAHHACYSSRNGRLVRRRPRGEISSLPRWCVMFPDATLSHTPLHCLFRARRAWGEAPCLTGQDLSPI
jgi:hypothetical protein